MCLTIVASWSCFDCENPAQRLEMYKIFLVDINYKRKENKPDRRLLYKKVNFYCDAIYVHLIFRFVWNTG